MWSRFEMEALAGMQAEEIARQVAANRRAEQSARGAMAPRRWRSLAAAALRVAAGWLAPAAETGAAGAMPAWSAEPRR